MDDDIRKSSSPVAPQKAWLGPTLSELARASGVGTATVDRVINGRSGVREQTRRKVLDALAALGGAAKPVEPSAARTIAVLSESGASFNRALEDAVASVAAADPQLGCSFVSMSTSDFVATRFAELLERAADTADGIVVVAREDFLINRSIRTVVDRGVPVVCVTTDLPGSNRTAYVGSDQTGAGATAAYMMGRFLIDRPGKVLLVISAPYRCQEERELGFRRVLRTDFPSLEVEERVNSNDEFDATYGSIRDYVAEHGPPAGIYNVAGGNLGVARALDDAGLRGKTLFIGHELNANSRMLLETGQMDLVVGHDLEREVELSLKVIDSMRRTGAPGSPAMPPVRLFTKFNCR